MAESAIYHNYPIEKQLTSPSTCPSPTKFI